MIRVLANDGLDTAAVNLLTQKGFEVVTKKIEQKDLPAHIAQFDAVVLRSATRIGAAELELTGKLKLIVRAGVGTDNIDTQTAAKKNVKVCNTPLASAHSVAEMVFAHLFSGIRLLHQSNRLMPSEGATRFGELKKAMSNGIELRGKTLGLIGFGNIGQEVARMAFRNEMHVVACDLVVGKINLALSFPGNQQVNIPFETVSKDEVLAKSDFISIHVSGSREVMNQTDFGKMKKGAGIINCSRGGSVNERHLLDFLNNRHLSFAGLDVFGNEPAPDADLLKHASVSVSPHTAASTIECQKRIGDEVAEIIIDFFGK